MQELVFVDPLHSAKRKPVPKAKYLSRSQAAALCKVGETSRLGRMSKASNFHVQVVHSLIERGYLREIMGDEYVALTTAGWQYFQKGIIL